MKLSDGGREELCLTTLIVPFVKSLVRAVFLDLGDTLVHLDRPWEEVYPFNLRALHQYLEPHGLRVALEEFSKTFKHVFDDASYRSDLYKTEVPMEEIIAKVLRKSGLKGVGADLQSSAVIEFFKPEIDFWKVYPDTVQTLTHLEREGYLMGVVSNTKSDWAVRAIVERRELGRFFKAIVTSAALKIRKPRPEIFTQALNALDVNPQDSVFVGDSMQADVAGAKHVGMRSIHVLRKPIDFITLTSPDATVKNLAETVDIINNWNNGSLGHDN